MRKQDIGQWIIVWIIITGMLLFLFVMPLVTAYGVITGKLDCETLRPITEETVIHRHI